MRYLSHILFVICTVFYFGVPSLAALKKVDVVYKDGKTELEGYLVYDEASRAIRPAVIVIHDWMGNGDYSKMRAEQIAEMGYVAFAADIYGKGIRAKDSKRASELATKYKTDRKLFRSRAKAAYDFLMTKSFVSHEKVAAIGYCFGGTGVLEMARSGLPLSGVMSFHGGLDNPSLTDVAKIKTKVIVAHGAIDPYVSAAEVAQFQKEMNEAKVPYEFISYSGAVHSFTQKHAGTDVSKGAAYDEVADKRSFARLKSFLEEIFE
jgi:dienelactone hydrolase